jgi:hypothetical protein
MSPKREAAGTEASMDKDLAHEIAALPTLNKAQLLLVWKKNFSQDPPPKLRKELMVPILAYRMQEKEFGGLSRRARKRLREIAESLGLDKRLDASIAPSLKSGTRLIRSWRGEVHEVSVTDPGFEYRGQHFATLSKIAREITGTRWSGPLFFGTRTRGIRKKA